MRDILHHVAPSVSGRKGDAQEIILAEICPIYMETLREFEIGTSLRIAHFTAQIAHESDGFCTTMEYASGAAYEGNRRLGNTAPGDGRRFKGRGLIQLTGRYNYARAGDDLGLDLLGDPDLAAQPVLSLRIACLYWRWRDLNRWADVDNLRAVTRKINGGYNGLADRQRYLNKAKEWLGAQPRDHLTWTSAAVERMTFIPLPKPDDWWDRMRRWFR